MQYGKYHQSLTSFDKKFPTFHIIRIRDLFDNRSKKKWFHGGRPWLKKRVKGGKLERNPHYAEWCKWMMILNKPWKEEPWSVKGPWGELGPQVDVSVGYDSSVAYFWCC